MAARIPTLRATTGSQIGPPAGELKPRFSGRPYTDLEYQTRATFACIPHALAIRLFSLQYLHSLSLSLLARTIECGALRSPHAVLSPSHHSESREYRVIIIPVLRIVHLTS